MNACSGKGKFAIVRANLVHFKSLGGLGIRICSMLWIFKGAAACK